MNLVEKALIFEGDLKKYNWGGGGSCSCKQCWHKTSSRIIESVRLQWLSLYNWMNLIGR